MASKPPTPSKMGNEIYDAVLCCEILKGTKRCYMDGGGQSGGTNPHEKVEHLLQAKGRTASSTARRRVGDSGGAIVGEDDQLEEEQGEEQGVENDSTTGQGGRSQEHPKRETRRRKVRGFNILEMWEREHPLTALRKFSDSWVLPEGYPSSVSPQYAPYMKWRAMQYLFGGAMGVFTTRSLLAAVGASRGIRGKSVNAGGAASQSSAAAAMAVNWVIKDGAGRLGKMLFARQGRRFDCELKQFRWAGNLLMVAGASVELTTVLFPRHFLALACCANLAKNLAAVTATSTRAPIYRAFARNDNIGDVTAKGESVSNLADLVGTMAGIVLSRRNPTPMGAMSTFAMLSCGYLFAAYNVSTLEVFYFGFLFFLFFICCALVQFRFLCLSISLYACGNKLLLVLDSMLRKAFGRHARHQEPKM